MKRAYAWAAALGVLLVGTASEARQEHGRRTSAAARREPIEVRVHPAALAELIDELGGRYVTVPKARVIVVLNPRAFLIESAGSLPATKGNLDRVLVMIRRGQLGVAPALLVNSTVKVGGVARTLLGIQVTREVPWPPELTADLVKRLEIQAAVLATSVHTPDGVELIQQSPPPE